MGNGTMCSKVCFVCISDVYVSNSLTLLENFKVTILVVLGL